MPFYLQSSSDGVPDRPTASGSQLVDARIHQNREAKRKMAALARGKTSCECGGHVEEDGAASYDSTPSAEVAPNDDVVTTYKGFELHCVSDPTDGDGEYYYAKHPLLGNMGHTDDVATLKRLIDRTKQADQPVMRMAKESARRDFQGRFAPSHVVHQWQRNFVTPNSAGEPFEEAKISAKRRAKLPASDFAGPNRSYPVPDRAHVGIAAGLAAMHGASSKIEGKIKKIAKRKFGSKGA